MTFLREFVAWLADYYAASTALLLLLGITRACLRQPIQRMVLAWATLISLTALLVLSAIPTWPRISLPPKVERARNDIRPPSNFGNLAKRSGSAIPFVADAASVGADVRPVVPVIEPPTPRTSSPPQAKNFEWPQWNIWLAAVFLVGAMAVVSWEALGMIQVRRLRSSGLSAPEFASQELESLVSEKTWRPRLLVSSQITAAVALGIWRPTILLPAHALEIPERPRLRSLLAHELAHLQRGDLWLLGWARLLLITQFAQPLFWWWRSQIRIDQELLADAAAAEVCGRQTYAENLVIWARLQTQSPLAGVVGIWESPGQLTRRIAILLDERKRVHTQAARHWYWGTGLTTLVLVTTLSLVTLRPGLPAGAAESPKNETQREPQAETVPVPAVVAPEESKSQKTSSKKRGILEIEGVCVDEQKQPLADVRLQVVFYSHDYATKVGGTQLELQETRSDAQGRFRFQPINTGKLFTPSLTAMFSLQNLVTPPIKKLIIIGDLKGRGTVTRSMTSLKSGVQSYELTLRSAAALRGRIVDDGGHPIVGATVSVDGATLRPLPGVRNAVTDADGRYEISDLEAWDKDAEEKPRQEKRQYLSEEERNNQSSKGYGSIRHPDFADRPFNFTVVPGTHDFTLPHPALVEGRITFEESGKPAAKVNVELVRDSTEDGAYGRETIETDAEGRYAITQKLLPGTYEIKARLEGWPPVVSHKVPIKAGRNVADLKIAKGGTIQLKVIEGSKGRPISVTPAAFTLVHGLHSATKTETHTGLNEDGTCTLYVLPGQTMLMIMEMNLINKNGISNQRHRWILADSDRKAFQLVDVAKGETKHVELRLLRTAALGEDNVMEHIDDEHEYADQISQFLDASTTGAPAPAATPNVAEKAAVAAIKQLGGNATTETINGQEYVVDVNMAFSQIASKPG